jgi:HTH-type transcriptional regulator/antitoxin HipB
MWAQSAKELGGIVSAGRRHRRLTQIQLAEALGVTQNWLSEIEQGKDTAQVGKILRVLSFLGIRLRVGEAPWLRQPDDGPARAAKISLEDIIAGHSGAASRPRATTRRGKARR